MKRKLPRQINSPKESGKTLNARSMKTRQMTNYVKKDAQGTDVETRRVLRKRNNILQNQNESSLLNSESNKENAFIKTPSKVNNKKGPKGKKVLGNRNLNDKSANENEIAYKDKSDIYDITLYLGSDELPNDTNKRKQRRQKTRLSRSLDKSAIGKKKKKPGKILMSMSLNEKKSLPPTEVQNDSSTHSENSQALWNISQSFNEQSAKEESQMDVEVNKENTSQNANQGSVNLNITDLQKRMSAMMTTDYLTSTPDKRESTIASDSSSCYSRRNSSVRDLVFTMSPIKDVPNDACYSLFADIEYPELHNIDVQEQVKRPKRDYSNIKSLSFLKPAMNKAKKANSRRKKPLDKKYEEWASTMNNHFQEVDSFDLVVE